MVGRKGKGKNAVLEDVTVERKHTEGPFAVICSIVDDTLTVVVNGKVVIRVRDPEPLEGGGMAFGTYGAKAQYKDVYGVILDGK